MNRNAYEAETNETSSFHFNKLIEGPRDNLYRIRETCGTRKTGKEYEEHQLANHHPIHITKIPKNITVQRNFWRM